MRVVEVVEADLNRTNDAEAVLRLIDAYSQDPLGAGEPLHGSVRDQLIDGLRQHPTTLVLIAYVDGAAAGIAVCFRGFSTFAAKPLLNIHDFAVLRDYRGQGVARTLMQAVEAKAIELDCCKLTLEVLTRNARARAIYAAAGFAGDPERGSGDSMLFLSKTLA